MLDNDEVEPLADEIVAEIIDSGGQPQFLEILPRFIRRLNLVIIVTNLRERLDEFPSSYFYGEDGELVGKGEPSKITNEQMLRQFLQVVVSQSQENSQIKVIIVGTHEDLEHECTETREEKEMKISDIMKSLHLEKNTVYSDHKCKKLIFAINAKDPKEADYKMGQRVMKVLMDEDEAETINMPLKFHLLEEAIKEMSIVGKISFTVNEIMQYMNEYFNDEASLKEGLQYLEQSNRIVYFNELFPDKVIGKPQAVLNMVKEIVQSHIRLNGDADTEEVMDGVWKKFKDEGILTMTTLKKISKYDDHFTPDDMLKLLEKLLILFKRSPGEFLMPCLLSTEASMPTFASHTADPMHQISMMLHFPKGIARIGIFCSTICNLISGEGWKHYDNSTVSRNCFFFEQTDDAFGVVCVQDSYDFFFQVTLHFSSESGVDPEVLQKICVALQDRLKRVINEVTTALYHHPDEPVLAFKCVKKHTPSFSLHAARYNEIHKYLRCTKEPMTVGKITDSHRFWLG